MARTDYAGNSGSTGTNQCGSGPGSLAEGDNPAYWTSGSYASGEVCNGILYQRSHVRMRQITRGTSNVYLVGERYMNPSNYYTGVDGADNESMYVGFDNDIYRSSTAGVPKMDTPGYASDSLYGGVHYAGINMAFCDGSVRVIDYNIDPTVFGKGGNRSVED